MLLKHWKLSGILYVANLLFALLISFPIFQFLNDKLSHSLAIDKLEGRFDYTVFSDILNEYGVTADFLVNQSLVGGLLFLLLSVFLTGGVLTVLRSSAGNSRYGDLGFWAGAAKFYWRILGLTLMFLMLQGLIAFAFMNLFGLLTEGGLDRFYGEAAIYNRAYIVFFFYCVVASIFWMLQDYVKVIMIREDRGLFSSIVKSLKFVLKRFGRTALLYLLCFAIFAIVYYLYWRTSAISSIGLAFLVGQIVLLIRIFTKVLNLSAATLWYDANVRD